MRQAVWVAFFLLAMPSFAFAAILPIRGEQIQLTADPDYPAPNTSVTITAHVSLESLAKTILWTVDDEYVTDGIGLTTLTIPVGANGTETRIEATIMEGGEIRGNARYVVRPAEVHLVWEGKTYVHPFYSGRPLANANANVVVSAFPNVIKNGKTVPPAELNFTWEVGGSVVKNKSGYGRSVLSTKPARYTDAMRVAVIVETKDGLYRARGETTIIPVGPRAIIYTDAPLAGITFNKAITNSIPLGGDEITVRAYPLFSANPEALAYDWRFNGDSIPLDQDDPRSATFRRTGEGAGNFPVQINFVDVKLLFERGVHIFNLNL